jgi:hypothetical protein
MGDSMIAYRRAVKHVLQQLTTLAELGDVFLGCLLVVRSL